MFFQYGVYYVCMYYIVVGKVGFCLLIVDFDEGFVEMYLLDELMGQWIDYIFIVFLINFVQQDYFFWGFFQQMGDIVVDGNDGDIVVFGQCMCQQGIVVVVFDKYCFIGIYQCCSLVGQFMFNGEMGYYVGFDIFVVQWYGIVMSMV